MRLFVNKCLIIKTGTSFPDLIARKGDFEDMIIRGMGIDRNQVIVMDVTTGCSLPSFHEISGAVITGSHAMVTEHQDWSERTAIWLKDAVAHHLPILGICYGHQLLAYALGGEVGDNPKGKEFGTVDVFLNEQAQQDPLFKGFHSPIQVHVSHSQTVLKLPECAKLLAVSMGDDCQAFSAGDCAWGVQFHPEFDGEIIAEYIRFCKEELTAEGKSYERLIQQIVDTPVGTDILKRFVRFLRRYQIKITSVISLTGSHYYRRGT